MSPESDDQVEDPNLPTANRVAQRALVLAALAGRGMLEMQFQQGFVEVASNLPRLAQWIEDLGIRAECETGEWEALNTPAGELEEQATIDSIWRMEGLGVLGWALNLVEFQDYDALFDFDEVLPAMGFLKKDLGLALIEEAALRSEGELSERGEQIIAVHWRLRDYSLRPVSMNFIEFCKTCWFGPIDSGWATTIEGDLALGGLPISAAAGDVVARGASSALERHVAINWLRGWSMVYSETDTST